MAQPAPQTFENHGRIVPVYHFFAFGVLLINLLWQLYRAVTELSVDAVIAVFLAVALIIVALFARVFALTAQDRLIRLEMRLRLAELAPNLASRFEELTVNQLCSLRFASDAELPALAARVLDERLDDRKAIKRLIKNWKPDPIRV